MERLSQSHQVELDQEHRASASVQQELQDRISELESLRKRTNREVSLTSLQDAGKPSSMISTPTKSEGYASREEITGLKFVRLLQCDLMLLTNLMI
jgi:hypothetical protein